MQLCMCGRSMGEDQAPTRGEVRSPDDSGGCFVPRWQSGRRTASDVAPVTAAVVGARAGPGGQVMVACLRWISQISSMPNPPDRLLE